MAAQAIGGRAELDPSRGAVTIHRVPELGVSTFSFPTDIRFGVGARRLLAPELAAAGVRRPLVVTDRGVSGLAFFADLLDDLAGAGFDAAPFDGVGGNPVVSQVSGGVDAYRGHGADGI